MTSKIEDLFKRGYQVTNFKFKSLIKNYTG